MAFFNPVTSQDTFSQRLNQAISDAFDKVSALISGYRVSNNMLGCVVVGSNGAGDIVLPPLTDITGHVLVRAKAGWKLISAVNLTFGVEARDKFSPILMRDGMIHQSSTNNLSATNLYILVGN